MGKFHLSTCYLSLCSWFIGGQWVYYFVSWSKFSTSNWRPDRLTDRLRERLWVEEPFFKTTKVSFLFSYSIIYNTSLFQTNDLWNGWNENDWILPCMGAFHISLLSYRPFDSVYNKIRSLAAWGKINDNSQC